MTNVLRTGLRTHLVRSIIEDIYASRNNYYVFLAKVDDWGLPSSSVPPLEPPSRESDENILRNIFYVQKVNPGEVSLVTRRIDWESGEVYDFFDSARSVRTDASYRPYVITPENNVYVCLDNAGGEPSTVKPIGRSILPFRTSDGYLWKYVYSIPQFKMKRFGNADYIPIQRAIDERFYTGEKLIGVAIRNEGSGYTDVPMTQILISGVTTGSGATFSFTLTPTGGFQSVTVVNGGSGYTHGVRLLVTSATGIGAKLSAVVNTSGVIVGVTIEEAGIGYTMSDTIAAYVGGGYLQPIVSRVSGSIIAVRIVDGGVGYTSVNLTVVSSWGGTGKYGNPTAILQAQLTDGTITHVAIIDPGKDYPADTDTQILVQGDGIGAEITPIIQDGKIKDVYIENPGSGYSYMQLVVVGSGSGAVLEPIFAQNDYASFQADVEQTAEGGQIYCIDVEESGSSYSHSTYVLIEGDGEGAQAVAEYDINRGVKRIVVTSYGSGYTYATATLVDPIGAGSGAVLRVVLPPRRGVGFDVLRDFDVHRLCLSVNIDTKAYGDMLKQQDFRQYGMIKNPLQFDNRMLRRKSAAHLQVVECSDTTAIEVDDLAETTDTKQRYIVFGKRGNQLFLIPLSSQTHDLTDKTLQINNDLYNTTTVERVIAYPLFDKYSPVLLFAKNDRVVGMSTDEQRIVIKSIITM